MGKILSKLEQLFTHATASCKSHQRTQTASPPHSIPTQPPQASLHQRPSPLKISPDTTSGFQCRQLMGSLLAKLRGFSEGWHGGSTGHPAGGEAVRQRVIFDDLPKECKLRVFSFLQVCERGAAAQVGRFPHKLSPPALSVLCQISIQMVCRGWHELMQSPSLWSDVDLTQIPGHSTQIAANRALADRLLGRNRSRDRCHGEGECREGYDARLMGYLERVQDINPSVHRLSLTYDIQSGDRRFVDAFTTFLSRARCAKLRTAILIWDRFPDSALCAQSHAPLDSSPAPLGAPLGALGAPLRSPLRPSDLFERKRMRQRSFVRFFESFVAAAPNVTDLDLAFDWSPRTLDGLARLPLRHLSLRRYSEFRAVPPETLSRLLADLTRLESLTLELWTESGAGLVAYRLDSDSLRKVDMSACRGISVDAVRLPRVMEMRLSLRSCCGPLEGGLGGGQGLAQGGARGGGGGPCLYELLREGAPRLARLNDHWLRGDWRAESYGELECVLRDACPCSFHQPSHAQEGGAAGGDPDDDDDVCCCRSSEGDGH